MLTNSEIAIFFEKVANLLEIDGANPFRIRAYRLAADTIKTLAHSAADMVNDNENITRLPGIGKDLAGQISEIVKTGALSRLETLEQKFSPELHQILKLPGLGPKKVRVLYEKLNICTLGALQEAAVHGKLQALPGFGAKTEQHILQELTLRSQGKARVSWAAAEPIVKSLITYLETEASITEIAVAGSFRRRKETVGDIDVLVAGQNPTAVIAHFVAFSPVERVLARGQTKSSVVLQSGLQIDLRIVARDSFGAALHYFTGSQRHNIAIRKLAHQKGLRINEYGTFKNGQPIAGRHEKDIYAALDMAFIEPELREDRGEIKAALAKRLPELINPQDICGDLHCHTIDSDGFNTIEEMVRAAKKKKYQYLAVSNHTWGHPYVHGLDPEETLTLIKKIDQINQKLDGLTLLKSMEVDILEDGSLDLPEQVLKALDFTVCSIHAELNLDRTKQTERIIRAMDNPYFTILGHPSGQLINQKAGDKVDMPRIIEAARQRGCFLELNANPDRLDLNDTYCRIAKENKVLIAISTDAHRIGQLDYMRLGVGQARRGWLEANDVLNTRSLEQLKRLFNRGSQQM